MPKSLVDQIHALLDEHGWADFLVAVDEVARADGFLPLSAALDPIYKLINHNDPEDRPINGLPQ